MARRAQRRASGRGDDVETWQWVAAIRTNGGDVTAQRLMIISRFIAAEKAAGTWALTDDYWALWGENEIQALTSLKQRRLATVTAAPTFTIDRGYAFNGTTQYINTGFIPSTHAVALSGTSMRLAAYERIDFTSINVAAGVSSSATSILQLCPRTGTSSICRVNNSGGSITYTLPASTSLGYTAVSQAGSVIEGCFGYKNGAAMVRVTASGTFFTPLPAHSLYIGAVNGSGVASAFRAASEGFICVGAALSAAQELAQYTNVQAWATSIGAQV